MINLELITLDQFQTQYLDKELIPQQELGQFLTHQPDLVILPQQGVILGEKINIYK